MSATSWAKYGRCERCGAAPGETCTRNDTGRRLTRPHAGRHVVEYLPPHRGEVVVCVKCGQRGDERPGLTLTEYQTAAVFVGDQQVPTPQRLTCLACGHSVAVPRGSVDVVPVTPT